MGKFRDLTDQKFGRLIVIKRAKNKKGRTAWLCQCECGKKAVVLSHSLISGNTQSCGCLNREISAIINKQQKTTHGKTHTKLYDVWRGIKARCFNKNNHAYKDYGGRGITVCDEWKNDFVAFETWANANGYSKELSIDRINVNGNYCPENCRWATMKEQNLNTRRCHYIVFRGEKKALIEWAKEFGISRETIAFRLNAGWPLEKVFTPKDFRSVKGAT